MPGTPSPHTQLVPDLRADDKRLRVLGVGGGETPRRTTTTDTLKDTFDEVCRAVAAEKASRKRATRYLDMVRHLQAKLAMLQMENNKLRRKLHSREG